MPTPVGIEDQPLECKECNSKNIEHVFRNYVQNDRVNHSEYA